MTNDHPFYEVIAHAEKLIARGCSVFQKFSCEICNNRLTVDEPNTFYKKGQCSRCGHITDIEKNGCNFLLIIGRLNGLR